MERQGAHFLLHINAQAKRMTGGARSTPLPLYPFVPLCTFAASLPLPPLDSLFCFAMWLFCDHTDTLLRCSVAAPQLCTAGINWSSKCKNGNRLQRNNDLCNTAL